MEQTEVADFHKTIGQDMLEEPAEKLHTVEVGGAWAGTAHLSIGERDHAVLQADETVVGDGDLEDIRGEVGEGGVAVVVRLTVDIPGDGPDLRIDLLQQTGVAHLFSEEGAVEWGERFDRDKEVGAGRAPGRTVPREAPTRDNVVEVGVVLELSAPGMEDAGKPWEIGPDETRVLGQPFEGHGRCVKHRLVRGALMGADEGAKRLRDREGQEEMRPRKLLVQVVL
jgi:hypothetical protein